MLRGTKVALRARLADDVEVLHSELYEDVATRSRSDSRPWQPLSEKSSPFAVGEANDSVSIFSIVELRDSQTRPPGLMDLELNNGGLAGAAVLWGIDRHSRVAHIGMSLRPSCRGRGLGADTVRVLCTYGFSVLGLHRLQVETLADNVAMIRAATTVGFVQEGVLRQAAWFSGNFVDEVVLGLLATEWSGRTTDLP